MTHAQIHALVSQGKLSPRQAAALIMARRQNRQDSRQLGLLGRVGSFVIVFIASIFGVRADRA